MFLPNNKGFLSRKNGTNAYGETSWSDPVEVECGVVHLNKKMDKTTVRTDSSATRGHAEEFLSDSKILFPAYVQIGLDDRFEIHGIVMVATSVEKRYAVTGDLDHYEVDFRIAPP